MERQAHQTSENPSRLICNHLIVITGSSGLALHANVSLSPDVAGRWWRQVWSELSKLCHLCPQVLHCHLLLGLLALVPLVLAGALPPLLLLLLLLLLLRLLLLKLPMLLLLSVLLLSVRRHSPRIWWRERRRALSLLRLALWPRHVQLAVALLCMRLS